MDFLGIRFQVEGGGEPPSPCLKLVRIMLETSNLVRKYTQIVVSENIPLSTEAFSILPKINISFEKN